MNLQSLPQRTRLVFQTIQAPSLSRSMLGYSTMVHSIGGVLPRFSTTEFRVIQIGSAKIGRPLGNWTERPTCDTREASFCSPSLAN